MAMEITPMSSREGQLPLVSVITVNYNGRDLLRDCFESLVNLHYPQDKIELIMVDNGSTDGSVAYIKETFPQVKIIVNNENNYAKANNLGIRTARGDYIALINNDTKVEQEWLISLVRCMREDDTIGAAGSKILFMDGRINSAGHIELPNYYWTDRGFKEDDRGQYDRIEQIESVSATACIFRRSALEKVGLLDEDFHMFVEDVDISLRLRKQGWKILYCPNSIVYHKLHGTADLESVCFYIERNRLLFLAKHFPEKLADNLVGNGYFTQQDSAGKQRDIYTVFPSILLKLFNHHGAKVASVLLPSLFESLRKLRNLEKHKLISELDYELKKELNELKERESFLEELLTEKDRSISEKDRLISVFIRDLDMLKKQIRQKSSYLAEKEKVLCVLTRELESLRKQIDNFYSSETFRYFIHPLWTTLDYFKTMKSFFCSPKKRKKERGRILFIKPQRVSAEEAQSALCDFKETHPQAHISLVANLLYEDYQRLIQNQLIDEKFFYGPHLKKLGFLEQIKLVSALRKNKYDTTIVLRNEYMYGGYRRARIVAFLSGARKISEMFVGQVGAGKKRHSCGNVSGIAVGFDLAKQILLFPLHVLFLLGSIVVFVVFIVGGMQMRKLCYRLSGHR